MNRLYRVFLKGLFTVLPISITLSLVIWITGYAENLLGDPLRLILGDATYIPGLGVLLAIVLVLLVGLLVNNYIAAQFIAWFEAFLQRVPFIKAIYSPLHDLMSLFANQGQRKLSRVVLVNFPAMGVSMIGLVTRDRFHEFQGAISPESLAVFIPYSYAVGGFTVLVAKDQVRELSIPVEKAMQLAITGWVGAESSEPNLFEK